MLRRSLQVAAFPLRHATTRCSILTRNRIRASDLRLMSSALADSQHAGAVTTDDARPSLVQAPMFEASLDKPVAQKGGQRANEPERTKGNATDTRTFPSRSMGRKTRDRREQFNTWKDRLATNVENASDLQISRIPGGLDGPLLLGEFSSLENILPDVTLERTSKLLRKLLEVHLMSLEEDVREDVEALANLLISSQLQIGGVELVWSKLSESPNQNLPISLLVRIAIDRPDFFLQTICRLNAQQLESTLMPPKSIELLGRTMCLVYSTMVTTHLQNRTVLPESFFTALLHVLSVTSEPLDVLPRYSLLRYCPASLQKPLQNAMEAASLSENHWEADLSAAQTSASKQDWPGVTLHLSNVSRLCSRHGNFFPTRSLEYVNTIGSILTYANQSHSNIKEVIDAIIPTANHPEMQTAVYSCLFRYALIENEPDSATLQLLISRLPARAFSRPILVSHILDAVVKLNLLPPDHKETKYLSNLLSSNAVLASYYLSAWHLHLTNSRGTSNTYGTMVRMYAEFFDTKVLHALRLPFPMTTKTDLRRLDPTNITMNLMLTSYFQSKDYDEEIVIEKYQAFRNAAQSEDMPFMKAIMDGPGVYNAFLNAFARFSDKNLQNCINLMAELASEVTEESVQSSLVKLPRKRKPQAGPDVYSWCILLKALSGHGEWDACHKILESIRRRYPESYGVAANTVIYALTRARKEDDAVRLLRRIMMLGYEVDEFTVRALDYLKDGAALNLERSSATGKPEPP
jgi:pentatricopeptide repeat protein